MYRLTVFLLVLLLLYQSFEGCETVKPARNSHFPGWDLTLVLDFVCWPPFEPVQTADLKCISLKTAFFVGNCICYACK